MASARTSCLARETRLLFFSLSASSIMMFAPFRPHISSQELYDQISIFGHIILLLV
jgi:hypothetical protein